ncbi:hypothetical protein J6590_080659 [Homalodisca vitripennis]|nr:hypothetical protein J6590_080659 [Homalodisca vitripennis]
MTHLSEEFEATAISDTNHILIDHTYSCGGFLLLIAANHAITSVNVAKVTTYLHSVGDSVYKAGNCSGSGHWDSLDMTLTTSRSRICQTAVSDVSAATADPLGHPATMGR